MGTLSRAPTADPNCRGDAPRISPPRMHSRAHFADGVCDPVSHPPVMFHPTALSSYGGVPTDGGVRRARFRMPLPPIPIARGDAPRVSPPRVRSRAHFADGACDPMSHPPVMFHPTALSSYGGVPTDGGVRRARFRMPLPPIPIAGGTLHAFRRLRSWAGFLSSWRAPTAGPRFMALLASAATSNYSMNGSSPRPTGAAAALLSVSPAPFAASAPKTLPAGDAAPSPLLAAGS